MTIKEQKAAEAQARAELAEKIKVRDAIRVSLARAQTAQRETREASLALIEQRSALDDPRNRFDGEDERLARLRALVDSGKSIPASRLESASNAAKIARLDEEIAAAQSVQSDLEALIRRLKLDLEWLEAAVKAEARRVLTPAIQVLHDRIAAAQAVLKPECALLRRLLRSADAPPEISNSLVRILSGPFHDVATDGFPEWETALAALEMNASAPLPQL